MILTWWILLYYSSDCAICKLGSKIWGTSSRNSFDSRELELWSIYPKLSEYKILGQALLAPKFHFIPVQYKEERIETIFEEGVCPKILNRTVS